MNILDKDDDTSINILSVDAYADDCGYSWNSWNTIKTISINQFESLTTPRKILKYFRDAGILCEESKGKLEIDDDQYNIVICIRSTHRPIFAIEYGPIYN